MLEGFQFKPELLVVGIKLKNFGMKQTIMTYHFGVQEEFEGSHRRLSSSQHLHGAWCGEEVREGEEDWGVSTSL